MVDHVRANQPLRVLFYVQHLLGIGHLMRARRIALALKDNDFDVVLVTGGMPLPGFDVPGVEQIALPPMAVSADFREMVDATGTPIDDSFKHNRCGILLDAYERFVPDIVLLEAYPFGRRQVRFELLPLINAIEASTPKPMLLSSIRDILQIRIKPDRDAETVKMIQNHFDAVLVHGDPVFEKIENSFSLAEQISEQIIYTGLVSGPKPAAANSQYEVVVSAGGGAVGAELVRASIEAAKQIPEINSWCVITGPNMPEQDYAAIVASAPPNVKVEKFREDFTSLLAGAQLSISQAGYNTVSDVLQAKCRCLLVPFSSGGETEQAARAQRLKELDMATVVSEGKLSGQAMVSAIRTAMLQTPDSNPAAIDSDGANNTARILQRLVGMRT